MFPIVVESEKICNALSWFISVGAITLFPFIICRDKSDIVMINHESIHIRQQLELGIIFFYIIYLLNWLYNMVKYEGDTEKSYHALIFEVEAYAQEYNPSYLKNRPLWACFKSRDTKDTK